jgi:hypothetical protein
VGAGIVTASCWDFGGVRWGTAWEGTAAITIEGDEVGGRLSGLSAIEAGPSRRDGVSRRPIPTVSDSAATAPCAQESLMWSHVWAVYETLSTVEDVELLGEPEEAFWGGGFAWRDPEGNVWDVAWAKGSRLDERGGLVFP